MKAAESTPTQYLDLNRAEEENYPPEKLRITLERFYTSVVVGFMDFFSHISRLRSWKEPRRTSAFAAVYFAAWAVDLLVPTLMGVLAALIVIPRLRRTLFPPPPPSWNAGGASDKPPPLPERHKGERAEQEASELVNSLATVAMESSSSRYGQSDVQNDDEDPPTAEPGPDPPESIGTSPPPIDATSTAPPKEKKNKPAKKATNQTMRVFSDITDIYERFAK